MLHVLSPSSIRLVPELDLPGQSTLCHLNTMWHTRFCACRMQEPPCEPQFKPLSKNIKNKQKTKARQWQLNLDFENTIRPGISNWVEIQVLEGKGRMASSMSAPYTKQVQGQSEQFSNLEHVSKLQKQKERGIVYNQALEFISQHTGVGRFLALCPREQENKVPGIPGLQNKLLLEHNRALSSAYHSECSLLIFNGFAKRWRTARQGQNTQELKISQGLSKQWNRQNVYSSQPQV